MGCGLREAGSGSLFPEETPPEWGRRRSKGMNAPDHGRADAVPAARIGELPVERFSGCHDANVPGDNREGVERVKGIEPS